MTKILDLSNGKPIVLKPTLFAKQQTANQMFSMGLEFLKAALLLEREGQKGYVSLHLICQGLELVLKSLLIHQDYDKYSKLIGKREFGHDLVAVVDAAIDEFGVKPLSPSTREQLAELNKMYKTHRLRYVNTLSLLGYYLEMPIDLVFRKLLAVVKLSRRSIFPSVRSNNDDIDQVDTLSVYHR